MTKKSDTPAIRFKGFTDTWEQRKAKELCNIGTGKSNTQDQVENGLYPFYIRSDIPVKSNKYLYDCEAVITIGDGNIGRVFHYVNGKFDLHQRCYKMTDFQDIWGKYFYYFFSTRFYDRAMKMTAKATVDSVRLEMISEMDIWKPIQIDEQKKIAEFFTNLDNLITLHQRKYDKLTNVKKSMLEKMFPKNGSNVPEIRFKGFTEAWEQRKVREVTDRYDNLRIPVAASLRVAGTTPYYGANGIQDYVDGYTHDGEFILVAEDGANDLKNYPVKCVKGRIWVNNHAHVLQGKYDCADNQFLAYAISQADIESLLVGGGRAKLNAETLMGIDLLLPNKAEQIRIGKYLAQLDNLITLHQRELEKLKNIKKSCLENMFV